MKNRNSVTLVHPVEGLYFFIPLSFHPLNHPILIPDFLTQEYKYNVFISHRKNFCLEFI